MQASNLNLTLPEGKDGTHVLERADDAAGGGAVGFMNGDAAVCTGSIPTDDVTVIYVTSPDMGGYLQVSKAWQEPPLKPTDDGACGVLKIEGKHVSRYVFDARVREFTQLLPNYIHVRVSERTLVNPSSTPKDDVFERKDNYYVYLKPYDVADDVVLRRKEFTGKPSAWIPMPPHRARRRASIAS